MSYSNPKERELLARVERLEVELKRLREELQKTQGGRWNDLFTERYRLVDELERLREENKALSNELGDAIDQSTDRWKRIQAWEQSDAVSPNYLARLHRIEEAARKTVDDMWPRWNLADLRTALEKDPDREFTSGRETFPFGEEA